jgi:hypothetical protein
VKLVGRKFWTWNENSIKTAEDNVVWSDFEGGIRNSNMLFQMVLSMFEFVNCRWSYEAVNLVKLVGRNFWTWNESSISTKEDNVLWSCFEGGIYKSKMLFQMVLFLFGLADCRLSYEGVKLVMFMWVGVFELRMKTVHPPRKIMSPGFASRVHSTSRTCAFKWYYSCLSRLTVG